MKGRQEGGSAPQPPRMLNRRDIDTPDELEVAWSTSWNQLHKSIDSLSDVEALNFLQAKATESPEKHMELNIGLLFGIFTNPAKAAHYLRLLSLSVRDGFSFATTQLKRLALEKYHKLEEDSKKQLLWLVQELIKHKAPHVDGICSALLRQIATGDLSPKNTALTMAMLKILSENKAWMYSSSRLAPVAFYTFMRILNDHNKGPIQALRQQEIVFCSALLREKFEECKLVGRDLVRLLEEHKKIPEFEAIWKDLIHKPSVFSPSATGMNDLLAMRTPSKFLASRLTPDMENHLLFVLKNVKMGNQKRYQTWFMQKYLSTPDSESLVPDLIRYICGVYHPTNAVLCSDIVPRWAIIGWLLKCIKLQIDCRSRINSTLLQCETISLGRIRNYGEYVRVGIRPPFLKNYMEYNAKMALFWDWFFYDIKSDNIMNIEPAMLLMMHSIPKYADITRSLLEFLVQAIESFDDSRRDIVKRGIFNSFSVCLSKGVVSSLVPLYNCQALDPGLRKKLQPIFRPFLKSEEDNSAKLSKSGAAKALSAPASPVKPEPNAPKANSPVSTESDVQDSVKRISKGTPLDTVDILLDRPLLSVKAPKSPVESPFSTPKIETPPTETEELEPAKPSRSDIPESLATIEKSLTIFVDSLKLEPSSFDTITTYLRNLLSSFEKMMSGHRVNPDAAGDFAVFLANALSVEFESFSLSAIFSPKPVLHHLLFNVSDVQSTVLLSILHELRSLVPSVGFRFMAWLLVNAVQRAEKRQKRDNQKDGSTEDEEIEEEQNVESDEDNKFYEKVGHGYRYFPDLDDNVLQPYANLIEHILNNNQDLQEHPFITDCKVCALECPDVFVQLVPYIYRYLKQYIEPSRLELLQVLVSTIDPTHIEPLTCKLILGEFEIFGPDPASLLSQTLDFESVDQFCIWQFLSAEFSNRSSEALEPIVEDILQVVQPYKNPEVLQGLAMLLRHVRITVPLIRSIMVLSRPFGHFSCCLLSQWQTMDAQHLYSLLIAEIERLVTETTAAKKEDSERLVQDGRGMKRKRGEKNSRTDSNLELVKHFVQNLDMWCATQRSGVRQKATERRTQDNVDFKSLVSALARLASSADLDISNYEVLRSEAKTKGAAAADARGDATKKRALARGSLDGSSVVARKKRRVESEGEKESEKEEAEDFESPLDAEDTGNNIRRKSTHAAAAAGGGAKRPAPTSSPNPLSGNKRARNSPNGTDRGTSDELRSSRGSLFSTPQKRAHQLQQHQQSTRESADSSTESPKRKKVKKIMDIDPEEKDDDDNTNNDDNDDITTTNSNNNNNNHADQKPES